MLLFPYDFILLMSTYTWLFDENVWTVNLFMNGIPDLLILTTHIDVDGEWQTNLVQFFMHYESKMSYI